MTKTQIMVEILARIGDALETKLEDSEYSEFIKGTVHLRLDLVKTPATYFLNVNLPGQGKPKVEIRFKRAYKRRQALELPPEVNSAVEK